MGYADPNATKYMVKAKITADGIVDKPDVVGAVFGQTEGLLGEDLDLRDLQKSGRIGRIEVDVASKGGKSEGIIYMSSSLDQVETVVIAATLESVDRVGPCKAAIKVLDIEDVRVAKREKIVERAKELLSDLMEKSKGSGADITADVRSSVQVEEITTYGKERLPAGPNVKDSDSLIIVEGRSDVLNLLRAGIKNTIAVEGTNIPKTVQDLSREKVTTAFVDGDRGGELILRELFQTSDIDYVARAPRAHEVEELSAKQLVKCLRNKVAGDQYMEMNGLSYEERELPAEEQQPEERPAAEDREPRREREDRGQRQHRHARRVAGNPEDADEEPAEGRRQGRRSFGDSDRWKKRREEPVEEQTVDIIPANSVPADVEAEPLAEPEAEDDDDEPIVPKPSRRSLREREEPEEAPASEEPASEQTVEEPVVEKVEEPQAEPEKAEEPVAEPVVEEPVVEKVQEAPVVEEPVQARSARKPSRAKPEKALTPEQESLRDTLRGIMNTHNSLLMDTEGAEIDRVAVKSLADRLKEAADGSVATVVYDGVLSQNIVNIASEKGVRTLVCKRKGKITKMPEGVTVWTRDDLE